MPRFVPGLELARAFYDEAIAPLLGDTEHAAALLGSGSDVVGVPGQRLAHRSELAARIVEDRAGSHLEKSLLRR